MITLVLNNQAEAAMEISNYNRNTTFEQGSLNSVAYFTVIGDGNTANLLQEIGGTGITSIEILNGEDSIYQLSELEAHITTINEYLDGDHITVNVNITF